MLQTAQLHEIDISTNFSWEPEILTSKLSPHRLAISATFHPDFADFDKFLAKAVRVKNYLAEGKIYTVAAPAHMQKLTERAQACARYGIRLQVMPLRGVEGAMTHPGAMAAPSPSPDRGAGKPELRVLNNEEQKQTIAKLSPAPERELEFRLNNESPKGKPCRAGFRYAVIRADGKVDRCSQCEGGGLGDIASPDFRLLDASRPCARDFCPIESKWLE